MKNLYLILSSVEPEHKIVFDFLKTAAETRGVEVKLIDPQVFDFTQALELKKGDGLYRISTDIQSSLVEKFLIQPHVASFFDNYLFCIARFENVMGYSLIHQKQKLPMIKTVFSLTHERELLEKYANYLGGFPIIIKAPGEKHGAGVMKIDSFDSLASVTGYLLKQGGNQLFVMRQFIPHKRQGRLVVVGNKVIASHENLTSIDFRSNVGTNDVRQRRVVNYSAEIQDIAVKAVNCLGYAFGGVDILFHEETGEPFIAEVNSPCFFPTTQRLTGVDIAGAMVDYLKEKGEGMGK